MADVPFLGCKISLISKCDIRYEGILYCVDPKESTISLSKVRSYGTETRGDPANFVPPKNDVYDIIIFRASDVKDLRVDAPEPPGLSDPAIISARQSSNSAFDANTNGSLPTSSGPSRQQQSNQGHQQKPLLPFLPTGSGKEQHSQQQKPQQSQPRHPQSQQRHQQQQQQQQQHQQPQRGYQRAPELGQQQKPQYSQAVSGRRDGPRMNRGGYRNHASYNNGDRRGPSPRDDGPKGPPMNRRRGGMHGGRRGRSGDRMGAPRGPRKTQPLKFEGEYDFDEANKIFLKLESKFKNLKVKDGDKEEEDGESSGDRVNSKKSTGQSESGSGYDSDDQNNKDGDSKEVFGGSVSGEFYDKSKSFFDNISCEASERGQGKIGKPDWRKERQTNAETFGISANYRRGGYRGRSFGANGYHRR